MGERCTRLAPEERRDPVEGSRVMFESVWDRPANRAPVSRSVFTLTRETGKEAETRTQEVESKG
jgi:hypothetical protein